VNNAGQAESAPLAKTALALWQRMLAVNLTGTFLCTREALPEMIGRGAGRIVNVASTAGLVGYAYVSAYCAAKHGVVGFTRAARWYARPRHDQRGAPVTETDMVMQWRTSSRRPEEQARRAACRPQPAGG
jgi:NAD(P)-dependent dehydrogenase (short-subunit alcohol dehydrogenase family)